MSLVISSPTQPPLGLVMHTAASRLSASIPCCICQPFGTPAFRLLTCVYSGYRPPATPRSVGEVRTAENDELSADYQNSGKVQRIMGTPGLDDLYPLC